MSKNKNKPQKGNKKKKGKNKVSDLIADAIADLVRKSTKKIIKSLEKKGSNLAGALTPAILKIYNGGETALKEKASSGQEAQPDKE
ncbi:hypothetical protein AHMF7605_16005 [Adhaeribacter arboris]|uniref:Uncharacterized protein n=1 Tax=Adhaeribacter arboris TaxID=2072846 RepID=A0A2T2YH95_9BACT|nr:hypothetical protein [Adhaeribacter arboris]PSR54896.1 hypothetical protein AHMF7605_16005 [Adhaeribacter arboris]